MKFRNAVVVLGAGASRGSNVPGDKTPPLDAEFLTEAANYFRGKNVRGPYREHVKAWKAFLDHLKGAGLKFDEVKAWRLEQLSTFLEARANLHELQLGRGRPRKFVEALDALKVVVCYVLRGTGGAKFCDLHRALFELVTPSAVLSFNYDLIADQSMLEMGILNWSSKQYRGARYIEIPIGKRSKYVPINSKRLRGQTPLLKLHGSMNWEKKRRGTGYRLSGCELPTAEYRQLKYSQIPDKPYIVPPVAAKMQIGESELRDHWRSAVRCLNKAGSWIIWGYSFPGTDTISQVLFRAALARNRKFKPVLVINPDMSVADRVKTVCKKVNVTQSPSMERFLLDHRKLGWSSIELLGE
jgi:hypothetical protein